MKTCFVSIDTESDFAKGETFKGIENLDKILDILKKYNITATLFVSGKVLRRYWEKARNWSKNYEIASHGFSHRFWNTLDYREKEKELDIFNTLFREVLKRESKGFRAPSHIIDEEGMGILEEKGFLYDSSVLPHYLPFKRYRGYKGRAPLRPYFPDANNYKKRGRMKILEIPVTGLLGFPLAGTWISKLPFFIYDFLLRIYSPVFLTFNLHSWDSLNPKLLRKIEKILKILKRKNYKFLTGEEIYASVSKNQG